MKNFIEFIKKYKIHILSSLLFIFFFRTCVKSSDVKKLQKEVIYNSKVIDSLNFVVNEQKDTIKNISEVIRVVKLKVHSEYDDYISEKNRSEQLMELHMVVKENIKKLQK
jgi:uncharacterized coiled-coil protein SlyX